MPSRGRATCEGKLHWSTPPSRQPLATTAKRSSTRCSIEPVTANTPGHVDLDIGTAACGARVCTHAHGRARAPDHVAHGVVLVHDLERGGVLKLGVRHVLDLGRALGQDENGIAIRLVHGESAC